MDYNQSDLRLEEPLNIADKLIQTHRLDKEEFVVLLEHWKDPTLEKLLRPEALRLRRKIYGNDVYLRGLIEISNICKNDCFYCGIRKSNPEPDRYRMKKEEILACCDYGYGLGLRTFVLQGGEDGFYDDDRLVDIVGSIKDRYPDCAITLSLGERSFDSYQALREAGADRYLMREETADEDHYRRLHPPGMSLQTRMNCLYDLTSLDYQVGAGFMVGSPYQTTECIAEDLVFLQALEPEMVGIGPFIPHCDTRFSDHPAGSAQLTLFLISVIRILLPNALIPATTALATLDPLGREKGMMAGANVLMPNISPRDKKGQYTLYDNKICAFEDAGQFIKELKKTMEEAGFHIVYERGDVKPLPDARAYPEEPEKGSAYDAESGHEISPEEKDKKKKKNKKKKDKEKDINEDLTEEERRILKEKKKEKKKKKKKKKKEKKEKEKEKERNGE